MDSQRLDGSREFREAEQWSRKLPDADEVLRREFAVWVKASTDNLKAFLLLTVLSRESKPSEASRQVRYRSPRISQNTNVLMLPIRHSSRGKSDPQGSSDNRRSPRNMLRWVAAAAIAAVVLLIAQPLPLSFPRTINTVFNTNIGERGFFKLPDGTSVQLNTNSRVKANYTVGRRDLYLERGEMYIDVADDRRRPFRVHASNVEIQDIGTVFIVRASPGETAVYVVKGRVRVSDAAPGSVGAMGKPLKRHYTPALEIGAGDEAVIKMSDDGRPSAFTARTVTSQESDKRVAWTQGQLILTGEPLAAVIREVNRYHKRPIVIVDPELQFASIGGIINPATDDYGVIARALEPECSVEIDESDPLVVQIRIDKRHECRLGG